MSETRATGATDARILVVDDEPGVRRLLHANLVARGYAVTAVETGEEALARLEAGTYGRCEVCDKPIPDERLEANPTARYDIEHERRLEAGTGLPRLSAPPL